MTVTRIAGAVGDNGASATASTHTIVIPATAAIGDVAILTSGFVNTAQTLTTPTGWTLLSGPDTFTSTSRSYLLAKTLVSGDPGSTLTMSYSGTTRNISLMEVWRNVTLTGQLDNVDGRVTTSTSGVLPTLASVPAGAAVTGLIWMRENTTATAQTVSIPAGYSTGVYGATGYASAQQLSVQSVYLTAGASGTYGGDALTFSATDIGYSYLVALADSSPAGVTPQLFTPNRAAIRRASTW